MADVEPHPTTLSLPTEPEGLRGRCFVFKDIVALEEYETALAEAYLPSYYDAYGSSALDVWRGREQLRNLIRPRGFNGRIGSIAVNHFEDPFDELIDAKPGFATKLSGPHLDWYRGNMLGMLVAGELYSSGRGVIGSLKTRIWIYPRYVPEVTSPYTMLGKTGSRTPRIDVDGAFNRVVEHPKQVNAAVKAIMQESAHVAQSTIELALAHPLSGGFLVKR